MLRGLIVPQTDIWSLTTFPLEASLAESAATSPSPFFEHLRSTVCELEKVQSLVSFGSAAAHGVAVASSVDQLSTGATESEPLPDDCRRPLPSPREFLQGVDVIRVLVARTEECQQQQRRRQRSSVAGNLFDARGLDRVLEHANRVGLVEDAHPFSVRVRRCTQEIYVLTNVSIVALPVRALWSCMQLLVGGARHTLGRGSEASSQDGGGCLCGVTRLFFIWTCCAHGMALELSSQLGPPLL